MDEGSGKNRKGRRLIKFKIKLCERGSQLWRRRGEEKGGGGINCEMVHP